jgi:hypothetical protein
MEDTAVAETKCYGEEITRRAPGCIVFLVDSSAGMVEVLGSESRFDGRALTKA